VGELLHRPTPAGFKNQNIVFVYGVYPALTFKDVNGRPPIQPSPSGGRGNTVAAGKIKSLLTEERSLSQEASINIKSGDRSVSLGE
jgi:hypothetical protein